MPVPQMTSEEIEEAIGRMDPDLLSQLLKNDVNSLNIATLSKAKLFPPGPIKSGRNSNRRKRKFFIQRTTLPSSSSSSQTNL
jgi:hypothetical protein